jgi:hypothetical protein
VYSPEKLNSQLATAAASFCGQEVEVVEAEGRVRLSKLLLWYKKDFGNNGKGLYINDVTINLTKI